MSGEEKERKNREGCFLNRTGRPKELSGILFIDQIYKFALFSWLKGNQACLSTIQKDHPHSEDGREWQNLVSRQ